MTLRPFLRRRSDGELVRFFDGELSAAARDAVVAEMVRREREWATCDDRPN